jgi:hypothetical protein
MTFSARLPTRAEALTMQKNIYFNVGVSATLICKLPKEGASVPLWKKGVVSSRQSREGCAVGLEARKPDAQIKGGWRNGSSNFALAVGGDYVLAQLLHNTRKADHLS